MNDLPPALPNSITLPSALVKAWTALPQDAPLSFVITKEMIDHLFFAIDNIVHAQDASQLATGAYVSGDVPAGNQHLDSGRRRLIEGQNNLRQFLIAIMAAHMASIHDG